MQLFLAVGAAICVALGIFNLKQVAYFDGDRDAHAKRSFQLDHVPRHPFAKRARARGLVLVAFGLLMTAALMLTKALS
ncbi:MAG: hypothetical protein IAE78_00970 [Myxococcus sp.]|nr:hypothetical protein [Myxococcus sp.]